MRIIHEDKCYYLAARHRDGKLVLAKDLTYWVRWEFRWSLEDIEQRGGSDDARAFAASVLWERLGDFEWYRGSSTGAVRAYCSALLYCLDGTQYDHGAEQLPARWLRVRFLCLLDKALSRCCGNSRVREELAWYSIVEARRRFEKAL